MKLAALLLSLVLPSPIFSTSDDLDAYETAYACEESILNITCSSGLNLNIIRANFGRFSIAICNPHGVTDYSVNCMSPRTLRVIRSRCQGVHGCQVPVDSRIFGDPCPSTRKYVEVHYSCTTEIVKSTTARPRPPWYPEPPPNSWADIAPPTSVSPTSVDPVTTPLDEDEDIEDEHDYTESTERVIKVKVPKPFPIQPGDINPSQPRLPVIQTQRKPQNHPLEDLVSDLKDKHKEDILNPVISMLNFTYYCPPITARGLFWNWTVGGDTAVLECPGGSIGFAKWKCGRSPAEWSALSPSLAECESKWLNNLDARLRDGESISTVSGDLAQLSGLQPMYGGDLRLASKMLKHMAERMNYDIQGVHDAEKRESMVTELVQNVVLTGSNILDRINHVSWSDLSTDDVATAATALMVGLEENAFLLANSVSTEKIIIKPTTNILLSIRVMQARNTVSQRFPTVENLEMWDSQQDSILLSSRALRENSENGAVRIIFATYNEFDELLVPTQRPNSTLRFVNSKVISAALGKGKHTRLQDPVKITLKHLRTENVSNPVCVFWNFTTRLWSNSGCRMINTNLTHTLCECDHLTNFALIMDEGPGDVSVTLTTVTNHITTIIACVATLVCVTILVFATIITWRKFRVSHQCRSMLQKSGIPCFHKTKELSEKDKKQGNFYTVTPKLNGSINNESGRNENNIELDTEQQYFQHMISMQKNQDTLGLNKTMRRNTTNAITNADQETSLTEVDLKKSTNIPDHNLNQATLNARKTLRLKSQCQHATGGFPMGGIHPEQGFPKRNNIPRAMSPFNHIYMEIDPKTDEATLYEALNQSERSETYMLSSVSDMSDEDFRRCSEMSRQSSSRYAENKPLIRQGFERNLLTTISGVMQQGGQSVRAPTQHHRTSILSTISGLRYTDPTQPGQPSLNLATGEPIMSYPAESFQGLNLTGENIQTFTLTEDQIRSLNLVGEPIPGLTLSRDGLLGLGSGGGELQAMPEAAPLQVTTVNGNQFVCLNLQDDPGTNTSTYVTASELNNCYASFSDTYIQGTELRGVNTANFVNPTSEHCQPGMIQTPVHSQLVIQRVGTLPRQYAHPLAQM